MPLHFYFYTRNFGDRLINSSSDNANVRVFASKFSNNNLGVIIVNESPVNYTASIDTGFNSRTVINAWVLTGDSLTSKDISLNGEKSGFAAGGPVTDTAFTPYYLEKSKANPFTINLEKYSVTSLVIDISPRIIIENCMVLPDIITNKHNNTVLFQADITSSHGNITNVEINLSSIGGSPNTKMVNTSGILYETGFSVSSNIHRGIKILPVTAYDSTGVIKTTNLQLNIISIVSIKSAQAFPDKITNTKSNNIVFSAYVDSRWATISNVYIDLSSLQGNNTAPMVNYSSNYYSNIFNVPVKMPAGDYKLTVSGTDMSNNMGISYIIFHVVDRFRPTSPMNLKAEPDKEKVLLTWDKAEDETGISRYMVCRTEKKNYDTITNTAGKNTVYIDNNIENSKTYYYKVIAIDTSGNESLPSNEVQVYIPDLEGLIRIQPNYIKISDSQEAYVNIYRSYRGQQ